MILQSVPTTQTELSGLCRFLMGLFNGFFSLLRKLSTKFFHVGLGSDLRELLIVLLNVFICEGVMEQDTLSMVGFQ